MIALATPPLAAPTIVARAVAMKSALPRPQPARKPTIWPIVLDDPASALKITIRARPMSSVGLGPIRLATAPVISIATPVTAMYDVKSSETCDGEACSCSPIGLRIGSTNPMPMNAMTQAKATAQTALG